MRQVRIVDCAVVTLPESPRLAYWYWVPRASEGTVYGEWPEGNGHHYTPEEYQRFGERLKAIADAIPDSEWPDGPVTSSDES